MPSRPAPYRGPTRTHDGPRGNANARGYTWQWRKARAAYLSEHPLCAECERQGRLTVARCVDHVVPHRGDERLFWDEAGWQPLCTACHARKSAREG